MSVNASLKQLEALFWVGKLGSFQSAALRLHTSQSAVSKRIAELEAIHGAALFDRSSRASRLTAEGERLAAGAEELLALYDRVMSGSHQSQEKEVTFRLAATELIGMTWLPSLMSRIKECYPHLLLKIDVDHGGRLLERLNQGQFDLALVPGPMWGKLYAEVPLNTLERCWMASPTLAVPRRTLTVEELADYPIVSQYSDTIHARLQSAWFHRNGHLMKKNLQANSFFVVGRLVIEGKGIAQMPVPYYAQELRDGTLRRIKITPALPNVRYYAVYRRSMNHPLVRAIATLAQEMCDFRQVYQAGVRYRQN